MQIMNVVMQVVVVVFIYNYPVKKCKSMKRQQIIKNTQLPFFIIAQLLRT